MSENVLFNRYPWQKYQYHYQYRYNIIKLVKSVIRVVFIFTVSGLTLLVHSVQLCEVLHQYCKNVLQANKLSPEQITEYKGVFEMFDEEGNGDVKTQELERLMSLMGINPTKRELLQMAKDVDKDGKNKIESIILYLTL